MESKPLATEAAPSNSCLIYGGIKKIKCKQNNRAPPHHVVTGHQWQSPKCAQWLVVFSRTHTGATIRRFFFSKCFHGLFRNVPVRWCNVKERNIHIYLYVYTV